MNTTAVAIIGNDDDASHVLFLGLRDFPAQKVILLADQAFKRKAERIRDELSKFHIPLEIRPAKTGSFEDIFRAMYEIRQTEMDKQVILHVDTDYPSSCIALSAAFVNGLQAIGVLEGKIIAYPIMKFSYESSLSDRKRMLLVLLREANGVDSLEELSKLSKMNLPLVTYHVRGSRDKPGLERLGLVTTRRNNGRIRVELTTLGNLLVNGLVDTAPEEKGRRKKKEY